MPFRFVAADQQLALATAGNHLNPSRVAQSLSGDLGWNGRDVVEMRLLRNVTHDNDSTAKLIQIGFLDFPMIEVSQTHLATVIGRSNFDRRSQHRFTSLSGV